MKTALIVLAFFVSSLASAQWVQTGSPPVGQVYSLLVCGTGIYSVGPSDYVMRTTNNGTTWTGLNNGLSNTNPSTIALCGTNLVVGGASTGVLRSTDNGATWNTAASGLGDMNVNCFAVSGANLFAGTNSGVFLSTNTGTSWSAVNSSPSNQTVYSLLVSGANLYAGVNGLLVSTNSGTSWSWVKSYPGTYPWSYAVSGTNLFVGGAKGGVYVSTNSGTSWTTVSINSTGDVNALVFSGADLFAGVYGAGVFHSTNNGTNWTAVNNGLGTLLVFALATSGSYLFAGTATGVWRRPLSELVSVEESRGGPPAAFDLHQNYPNPFNPSTVIQYDLPQRSHVALAVFNALGQQVATLVNESQEAGIHEVRFEGSGLASGVYFYRIQAGDFVAMKKLILLR